MWELGRGNMRKIGGGRGEKIRGEGKKWKRLGGRELE